MPADSRLCNAQKNNIEGILMELSCAIDRAFGRNQSKKNSLM